MGTSAPSGPVSGNHPLIPGWVSDDHPVDLPNDGPRDAADDQEQAAGAPVDMARRFAGARSNISSAIRLASTGTGAVGGSGGGGRRGRQAAKPRDRVQRAVQQYVSALGGSRGVASRLGVAVNVGARLFQVLDRVARDGLEAALRAFGRVVDEQSAGAVADALMTLVCEDAAVGLEGILDESMARAACDETFIGLYERGVRISELTPEQVPDVICSFAINAACLMITRDIATALVDRPRTEEEARTLHTTLESVIASSMRLELPTLGPTTYTIRDIREAIGAAYNDAFRILGARDNA